MKTFGEFCLMVNPGLIHQYMMYKATESELIGKTVVSIRSGFSTIGGGLFMILTQFSLKRSEKFWSDLELLKAKIVNAKNLDELLIVEAETIKFTKERAHGEIWFNGVKELLTIIKTRKQYEFKTNK